MGNLDLPNRLITVLNSKTDESHRRIPMNEGGAAGKDPTHTISRPSSYVCNSSRTFGSRHHYGSKATRTQQHYDDLALCPLER